MSTSAARPLHGDLMQPSSCMAGRVAAPARPADALDRAHDPHRITIASPIPPFLFFCKIIPKVELKSKFG